MYVNAHAEGLMKSSNVEQWKTARVRVTFCLITSTYVFSIRYIHVPLHLLPLSLQRRYSPGWSSTSFKSFLHPSRFRATIFQFLDPSLATSSSTPSSQRSLGLPLGRFHPGSLRRTLLDKSSSSWRVTCPAHLSLLNFRNFTMSFSPHSW